LGLVAVNFQIRIIASLSSVAGAIVGSNGFNSLAHNITSRNE
jgi:hypothetical protein